MGTFVADFPKWDKSRTSNLVLSGFFTKKVQWDMLNITKLAAKYHLYVDKIQRE